jgi:hypothetical protein
MRAWNSALVIVSLAFGSDMIPSMISIIHMNRLKGRRYDI